ncbi:hypothetical protein PS1_045932 [Malus domestica]
MGKAGWPGAEEKEGQSYYSSGHLKTGVSSSDLSTNMKNKERGRGFYLPKTVTRSEVTGKSFQSPRFAGKRVCSPTTIPKQNLRKNGRLKLLNHNQALC